MFLIIVPALQTFFLRADTGSGPGPRPAEAEQSVAQT
jgi:hypothetical protein